MRRLAILVTALALVALGLIVPQPAQAQLPDQLRTPSPTLLPGQLIPPAPTAFTGIQPTATLGTRLASPTPGTRPNLAATATAAAATITAADATATANVAAPMTAVAETATALAVPTRTPTVVATATPSPTAAVSPSPTLALTLPPTAAPATPTTAPTVAATIPPASPTPDALAPTRTVLTRAPIAVGDETIAAGAPLQIPLEVLLVDGAIPSGTTVVLPTGQSITLPAGISIPAEDVPTVVSQPLNAVLSRASLVGDTTYPQGTVIVVPSGTSVLGTVEPNAMILLEPGVVVQVAGRTVTLVEPVVAVVSAVPVAAPAELPPTGEADPLLWPAALGLLLLLGGWRLLRAA